MTARRARSDLDKATRRDDIVRTAAQVLDETGFDTFTMDGVASLLDLVKGTLYRYFPTREALVLAVLRRDLATWFDSIDAELGDVSADQLGAGLVDSLVARPPLLQLLAVLPSVLEHNVPFETALDFKSFLLERTSHTGRLIDRLLGAADGSGARLLVRLNAAMIGLYVGAHPSPVVAQVLELPAFAPLRVDLAEELAHLTHALLRTILSEGTT